MAYGNRYPEVRVPGADKKVTAGILGLLFGGLGVHKFYLGYTNAGIIQLLASVFTCGAFAIIGHIEGIIYLTKSDQEFVDTYVNSRKEWF
jgi:TM2 domain-containing membrane protein YozV